MIKFAKNRAVAKLDNQKVGDVPILPPEYAAEYARLGITEPTIGPRKTPVLSNTKAKPPGERGNAAATKDSSAALPDTAPPESSLLLPLPAQQTQRATPSRLPPTAELKPWHNALLGIANESSVVAEGATTTETHGDALAAESKNADPDTIVSASQQNADAKIDQNFVAVLPTAQQQPEQQHPVNDSTSTATSIHDTSTTATSSVVVRQRQHRFRPKRRKAKRTVLDSLDLSSFKFIAAGPFRSNRRTDKSSGKKNKKKRSSSSSVKDSSSNDDERSGKRMKSRK